MLERENESVRLNLTWATCSVNPIAAMLWLPVSGDHSISPAVEVTENSPGILRSKSRASPGVAAMTTILIADDHDVVRFGLQALLSERAGWEVVGEAANGKEAVAQAIKTKPDVASQTHKRW